ncbi:MAG: polysaccharide deacetylase family protein [Thermoleophilia bacterium]
MLLLAVGIVAGVAVLDAGPHAAVRSPGPTIVLWSGAASGTGAAGPDGVVAGVDVPAAASTTTSTTTSTSVPSDAVPVSAAAVQSLPARLPILMYHYVDDEPPPAGPYADGLTVRTPDFREEMAYLAENGYRTVLLEDVAAALQGGQSLPAGRLVALTFDDGGLDNYTVAFPILREHGFVATFFVVSGRVGAEGSMTVEQLKEMRSAGMSIQSHTRSHPDLTGLGADALRAQLVGSKADIEEKVGGSVRVLCYPAGSYDKSVVEAARSAGYTLAVTTKSGKDLDPASALELPRMRIPAFMSISSFAKAVQ